MHCSSYNPHQHNFCRACWTSYLTTKIKVDFRILLPWNVNNRYMYLKKTLSSRWVVLHEAVTLRILGWNIVWLSGRRCSPHTVSCIWGNIFITTITNITNITTIIINRSYSYTLPLKSSLSILFASKENQYFGQPLIFLIPHLGMVPFLAKIKITSHLLNILVPVSMHLRDKM